MGINESGKRKIISRPGILLVIAGFVIKILSSLGSGIPIIGKAISNIGIVGAIAIKIGIALIVLNLIVFLISKLRTRKAIRNRNSKSSGSVNNGGCNINITAGAGEANSSDRVDRMNTF